MGCGGSAMDIYEPKRFRDKTIIWFLGGGPGAPKQPVAQFLIERYKFKLISAIDLVHFEEKSGSPEAAEVKKCIEQKQQFPPQLIIRILKRIFSLYGPRKYLLQGFPRSEDDVHELIDLCAKYTRVQMLGYINLNLTEQQMKDSGVKALKQMKKDQKDEDIQKEVRNIIEAYRNKIKPVLDYYQTNSTLINLDFVGEDPYKLNLKLEQELAKQDIAPVIGVPVHFLQGNDSKQIALFGTKLAKKFGMLAWGIEEMIAEAASRPQFKKDVEKPIGQMDEQFLVKLVARKIDKNNFKGPFLFWGYPRKEEDLKALRLTFLRELQLCTFSCCLHTPTTQNQQTQFQKLHDYFKDYEKIPALITTAGEQAYRQIQDHVSKQIILTKGSGKLLVIPSLGSEGSNSVFNQLTAQYQFVQFKQLLKKQVEKQTLYADLIQSNETLDRPLPPPLAVILILNALKEYREKSGSTQNITEKPLIVRGFPQNTQQLKALHSRCPELKALTAVVFDYSSIKGQKEGKLAEHELVVKALEQSCDVFQRFSEKTPSEQYKGLLTRISSI